MPLSELDIALLTIAYENAVPAVLGLARIATCFVWIPYLGSGAIPSKLARTVLALVILLGLWPVTEPAPRELDSVGLMLAVGTEALIGTALGLTLALPYHAFHAMGYIIDSQRGAGVSAMLDPVSGVEATELANLLQLMSAVVFLVGGGMTALLEALQHSYRWWPMGSGGVPALSALHGFGNVLLWAAVRMAAPVLLMLLLIEVFLGVLSRFVQQMNAFSLTLSVKSFLVFLALLAYLMPTVVQQVPVIWDQGLAHPLWSGEAG